MTQNIIPGSKMTLRDRFAITDKRWSWYSRLFTKAIRWAVKFVDIPVIGFLLKKITLLDHPEKNFTQGYTINLNLKVDENDQNVILPIDLIKKVIEEASYIAIINQCLCRSGNKCQDYDIGLGCLFLGEGAKVVVKNGLGREATGEEALKHVDKAVGRGLVGQCLWVEAEKYVWGISDENMLAFLEICFCCPCCCLALQNLKKIPLDIKARFRSAGWKAASINGCNGCGICQDNCPAGAITAGLSSIIVSDQCLGCGTCASKCPQEAIEIIMISPPKESLQEYFQGFRPNI